MARDLVAEGDERRRRLRVALERLRDAEHGERERTTLELTENSPDAGARAVFVDRLHAHVPRGIRRGVDDLGEEGLRARIAFVDRALAALLVVEDELHCDASSLRPVGTGDVAAVAGEVARSVVRSHARRTPRSTPRSISRRAGSSRSRRARRASRCAAIVATARGASSSAIASTICECSSMLQALSVAGP